MTFATHAEAPPRRRWRKLVAAVIFVGIAFWAYAFLVSRSDLNRAIAETDALDPGWRFADIEAARAVVPEAQNSALVIEAGHNLVLAAANRAITNLEVSLDAVSEHPNYRLTSQQLTNLQAIITSYGPAMIEYRKVAHMPRGRWIEPPAANIISAMPMKSMHARSAASALRYDLYDRVEANDVPGAIDSLMAGVNCGRSIGDQPFMISTLVRIALDQMVVRNCERFLAQCEADEATLARLQKELESCEAEPTLYWGMRGERAFGFEQFEHYKSHPTQLTPTGLSGSWYDVLFFVPGGVNRHEAAYLRHMNLLLQILRTTPPEQWVVRVVDWDAQIKNLPYMAADNTRSISKVVSASLRHRASLQTAITVLAVERYRVQYGKWPATLEELTAAKLLRAIPLDPFDGQPLKWKSTAEGWVVYSVGVDRVDNGGVVGSMPSIQPGIDIGIRLYDVAKRRLTAPAPTPTPSESPQ